MERKTIKMADVCLSGFVFMGIFMLLYFIGERLGIVPNVGLYYAEETLLPWVLTKSELTFMLMLILQLSWIGGQLLYAKMRRFQITW